MDPPPGSRAPFEPIRGRATNERRSCAAREILGSDRSGLPLAPPEVPGQDEYNDKYNREATPMQFLYRGTLLATVAGLVLMAQAGIAQAQNKEVVVGVIYDYTGPFAAGGSQASAIGTKIAIDMINERGGVEGYRIRPIYADAQSKADVAINETTRLLDQEKVDLIMGVFSS